MSGKYYSFQDGSRQDDSLCEDISRYLILKAESEVLTLLDIRKRLVGRIWKFKRFILLTVVFLLIIY